MLSIVTLIGPLLAPLIGGQLLLLGDWRMVFIARTVFGALCCVTAFLRMRETWPKEKREARERGGRQVLRRASATCLQSRLLGPHDVRRHGVRLDVCVCVYITATPRSSTSIIFM